MALGLLEHRGPDELRSDVAPGLGVGATRLAIRDPIHGNQPVTDPSGRYSLVLNGEILGLIPLREELRQDGYEFHSSGDTEVALAAFLRWGPDFVDHLRGMFAIVVADHLTQTLYAFRDPMGIKPLFLIRTRDMVAVASEIKALEPLVKHSLQPRQELFDEFLVFGDIAGDRTLIDGVQELGAGQYLVAGSHGLQIVTYWHPFAGDPLELDLEVAEERLDHLLRDSATAWTESDVPMGILASGGLDSTLLAALMYQNGPQAHAFFADVYGADAQELEDFLSCAAYIGLDFSVIQVSEDDLQRLWLPVIDHLDEPLMDFNAVTLACINEGVVQQDNVKVLLCGEGNDELFAGYDRHKTLSVRLAQTGDLQEIYVGLNAVALPRLDLLVDRANIDFSSRRSIAIQSAATTPLGRLLDFDQRVFLQTRLRSQDQIGMMFSHEVRPLLLDRALVEFINALQDSQKLRDGLGKWLFRWVHSRYLPTNVSWRPTKSALQAPAAALFRTGFLADQLEKIIKKDEGVARRYDASGVNTLLERHRSGEDHSNTLWRILALHLWLERF